MMKAEVLEMMLYGGSVTWSPNADHYKTLAAPIITLYAALHRLSPKI